MKYEILSVAHSVQMYWHFSTQNLNSASLCLRLKRLRNFSSATRKMQQYEKKSAERMQQT